MSGGRTFFLPLAVLALIVGSLLFAAWYDGVARADSARKDRAGNATYVAGEESDDSPFPAAGLLEVRSVVPDFTFMNQDGEAMGLADLRGKVWVADFIYTYCSGPCPAMTVGMKKLQDHLDELPDLRFVTFTVDPARDTVAMLKRYATNTDADPKRWSFLRGDEKELARVMTEGFLLGSGDDRLNHSTRFCLVDQTGRVRGHYDYKRGDDMLRLRKHARLLMTGERN